MADQPKGTPTEDVARLETREYRRLLRRKTLKRVSLGKGLELLGRLIDEASDLKDIAGLSHALHLADEFSNRRLTSHQRITFHYFVANIWSSIKFLNRAGTPDSWSWEQEEIEHEITNLRLAVSHEDFVRIEPYRRCQILTNLGNLMSNVGRFVDAQEYWKRALLITPNFGMGLGNRAFGLFEYARAIPRRHDSIVMLNVALTMIQAALQSRMIHPAARQSFVQKKSQIEDLLAVAAKGTQKPDISTHIPYSHFASRLGATGFDRGRNVRRDACRATLCSSLKRVGKLNCRL